jgi:uncharacterized protein YeaO (DUF488 family)
MPIRTRRWNDPAEPDDGYRLLVCRYRPRGVAKADESWHAWDPNLAPSKALHGAMYSDTASTLPWATYRRRYLDEMKLQRLRIAALAARVRAGETITLLCSSACERESRCHRSLLRELIEAELTGG